MSKLKRDDGIGLPQRSTEEAATLADHEDRGDTVVCFLSGKRVPRHRAVRVRLGPGERVWMSAEYCRDG